ncbi:MAG: sensor histidine kinase [Candidatus Kapaibacterium sp.]
MNLSLRAKLTLWFGLVMAVSLAVFGALNYRSLSSQLTTGLDVALNKAVQGLDSKIKKVAEEAQLSPQERRERNRKLIAASKSADTGQPELEYFREIDSTKDTDPEIPSIQPLPAEKSDNFTGAKSEPIDNVWTSITEYVVLNPRNFMVQIMDTTGAIVYKSASLGVDTMRLSESFLKTADTSEAQFETITLTRVTPDSDGKPKDQTIRVALAKSRSALIAVAYPYDELQSSIDDFLQTLMLLIPVVLLVSTIGGWFFARASLHPVDELARTAQEITASNLSRRLPVKKSNDEIKRLTETLNDMISRLESSFGRIRQFTADASHELRTPLTILTGELELALRSARTKEEYQEVISSALQETLRMSRVVEDLLLLSRADMGRIRLSNDTIDLNEMLTDLADATAILGAEKELSITYRHEEGPLVVQGDHPRMYQMFLNLLDNAVKYTPHGGAISLTLHRDGEVAEVRVRDTGIGISNEDQKKIFDRFYRVDKARSRAQGGVGLGLSIVEWTVLAHEGDIRVESQPGSGSTFIVRLPLAPEAIEATQIAPTPEETERHRIAGALDHLPKFLKRKPTVVEDREGGEQETIDEDRPSEIIEGIDEHQSK